MVWKTKEIGGYGDIYDLQSISQFYEDNVNKNSVNKIGGINVDDMTNITLGGKKVSKNFIKGLKSEATFEMNKKNGIYVVEKKSIRTENDMIQGGVGMAIYPHGHLHPNFSKIGGKMLVCIYGNGRQIIFPISKSGIGGMDDNDMQAAGRENKSMQNATLRNILVNQNNIYLYNSDNYILIKQ